MGRHLFTDRPVHSACACDCSKKVTVTMQSWSVCSIMHQCNKVNSTLELLDEVFFVQNCKLSDTAEFLDPGTFLNGVKLLVKPDFFPHQKFFSPRLQRKAGGWSVGNQQCLAQRGWSGHNQPIRGQYSGHVTSIDQSEDSVYTSSTNKMTS